MELYMTKSDKFAANMCISIVCNNMTRIITISGNVPIALQGHIINDKNQLTMN